MNAALKKSVDAMTTAGTMTTKPSTKLSQRLHLPTIVKVEPSHERPALMSDDDMLLDASGRNRSRPPTPGLLTTGEIERKSSSIHAMQKGRDVPGLVRWIARMKDRNIIP